MTQASSIREEKGNETDFLKSEIGALAQAVVQNVQELEKEKKAAEGTKFAVTKV